MTSTTLQLTRKLYATAVGSAAGATVGMVGWGGAQVIIPLMTHPSNFANFTQLSATGISLSSLSLSTVSSGLKFWHEDKVNLPIAFAIGLPAVMSAYVGSHIAKKISGDALSLFFNGFSIVLIPTHFWIQQRASSRRIADKNTNGNYDMKGKEQVDVTKLFKTEFKIDNTMQHVSYGLFSGIISSLMGVGGLPLTMSYMTEATNLPHHYVQGTAVCAVVPSVLMSAISRINAIPLQTSACVAFGAILGGYGGAKVALDLTEEQLRKLYMGSLFLFGGRSAVGAFRNIQKIRGASK